MPSLYFYVVDYPEPALAVLPPASAVIGGVHPMATGEPYDSLVLEAARRLSA